MADEKRRLLSLTVVGGALDGRECLPDEVVGELLIGSDPGCQLVLDLPGISPIHARLWTDLDAVTVRDAHAPRGVFVNDARVETDTPLGEGDLIWLGPPGEPDSVCLRPAFAPWVEVLPTVASDDPFFVGEEPLPEGASGLAALAAEPPAPRAEATAAAESEPMVLVEDDLAALAGAVAAEEPLLEAAEVAAEPEVDPHDDFFVAEESSAAAAEAPSTKPVPVLVLPTPALAASHPAPAIAATTVPPAPVSAPVATPPVPPAPVSKAPARHEPAAPAPAATAAPAAAKPPSAAAKPAAATAMPAAAASKPASDPAAAAAAAPARRAAPAAAAAAPSPTTPSPAVHPGGPDRTAPHLGNAGVAPQPLRRRAVPAPGRGQGRPAHHGSARGWVRPVGIALAVLVLVGAAFVGWRTWAGGVKLDAISPARVRAGQHATLSGRGFAPDAGGNVVLFDDQRAKVLAATPERLEVEVPSPATATVGEQRASVRVRAGGRASAPLEVVMLQGPRLHGLSPQAALPGEEVTLAGGGWGPGASVRFGPAPAEIVELSADRIRVRVPPAVGEPGAVAPAVVTVGGVESNAAPFVVGHPPVVTGISPETAGPGELVQLTGVGFEPNPLLDDVRIGGVPALVVSASTDALGVVVPHLGPGEPVRAIEVRPAGASNVGTARLTVPPPPSPPGLRFAAEPFTVLAGRPHAVVASGIGPVFVLAASGGRSAAQRALEAQQRLNGAVEALRTTLGLALEARGYESRPVIGLSGRPEALLEVTEEDAAAYNEDWTRLRGRGSPVTPGRLARWWEALGRDVVLLELRGERPRHAAALAPEGRALQQLFELAKRTGKPASAPEVMAAAKPPLREGLRLVALRVPAGVTAPVAPTAAGPAAPAVPETPRLQLDGTWRGSEVEEGLRRYLTVTFAAGGGSISYEGGLTLTMPLVSLETRGRDGVRFAVSIRGGTRYYTGKWDGEKLAGSIAADEEGREVVASFELRR